MCYNKFINNSRHRDLKFFMMATESHLIRDASLGQVIFFRFSDLWIVRHYLPKAYDAVNMKISKRLSSRFNSSVRHESLNWKITRPEDVSQRRCDTLAIIKNVSPDDPELFINLLFDETWLIDNIQRYICAIQLHHIDQIHYSYHLWIHNKNIQI